MSYLNLDGLTVLVTGGTGTIGAEVVKELMCEGAHVRVYSRDQNKQFKMNYDLTSKRVTYVNGDICDREILSRALKGVHLVVHCAASKHVPLCEKNPDSAIKVNVEGTRHVLEASRSNGIKRFILLSTDKAVYPQSVMGCTKFLAERITLEYARVFPCSIVRLGNVFASNGSVVPTFADRIKHGLPIIVNNPSAVRYFIGKRECGAFIVDRLKHMSGGEVFIKKMKLMTIAQIAEAMRPSPAYPIKAGKLGEGEKVKECLITQDEVKRAHSDGDFITVNGIESKEIINSEVEFYTNREIKLLLKDA